MTAWLTPSLRCKKPRVVTGNSLLTFTNSMMRSRSSSASRCASAGGAGPRLVPGCSTTPRPGALGASSRAVSDRTSAATPTAVARDRAGPVRAVMAKRRYRRIDRMMAGKQVAVQTGPTALAPAGLALVDLGLVDVVPADSATTGLASTSCGSFSWQMSVAYAQRGANRHPTSALVRSGGRPGIE